MSIAKHTQAQPTLADCGHDEWGNDCYAVFVGEVRVGTVLSCADRHGGPYRYSNPPSGPGIWSPGVYPTPAAAARALVRMLP